MRQTLKNDLLTVEIDSFGAELQHITSNATGHEYLWQGDKAFWGRRSPVLFPFVGTVWNGVYRLDGREYPMKQHGFARDREFVPVDSCPDDEAWFRLDSDSETFGLYPRMFSLEIGYRLQGERITVMWRVTNCDRRDMPFHIGAHPAFNYPAFSAADPVHGYAMMGARELVTQRIREKSCVGPETFPVELDADGMLPLTGDTFSHDALILADRQAGRVSLLDKERRPYLSLLFTAPLVGLWSPRPEAPFMCIEPWWGRCDRVGFEGSMEEREYINILAPGEIFSAGYMIVIENI